MVGSQAHRSLIQHFTHRCIGMFLNIDYLIILVNDMQIVAFLLIH